MKWHCTSLLAGLIAIIAVPAPAQPASGSSVLTTPHFAFYSDLATNVHDALITAATARRSEQPELFTAGVHRACFDGIAASDRDGWTRAVEYYTAGRSTRLQRVLQRLELAGLVQRDGLSDAADRQFLEEWAAVRDAAAPAYRQCRWPAQDAVNRGWIEGVKPLLAAHETTLGEQLPALFKAPWAGLPFRVDVVETALPVGGDSARPDFPTLHILVSSTNSGNQDRAALEVVFHEASHFLAGPWSPLSTALAAAAEESGFTPPGDLVHQVHFFMTGETVRRVLARAGEPSYTAYLYAHKLFSDRFRDAAARAWPAYLNGTRTLTDAARDLVRMLRETLRPDPPAVCDDCAAWNQPRTPFKIFGNTYYVGPAGVSSVLIASNAGLILVDGALPQSAPLIDANIRALGFHTEDIKLILNGHAHYDHAGGIAALQRFTGARVAAGEPGVAALTAGKPTLDDPQVAYANSGFPPVANVRGVRDGEILRVGDVAVTAHRTPGHTPGSTTWTWRSCEDARCLDVVYADSLSAVSFPGFRFTGDATHPSLVPALRASIAKVSALPCDIMIGAHPSVSNLDGKVKRRTEHPEGDNPFVDAAACRTLAQTMSKALDARIESERAAR